MKICQIEIENEYFGDLKMLEYFVLFGGHSLPEV